MEALVQRLSQLDAHAEGALRVAGTPDEIKTWTPTATPAPCAAPPTSSTRTPAASPAAWTSAARPWASASPGPPD